MRRKLGWLLFIVGGVGSLIGMAALAGMLELPLDLSLTRLETDADAIDWMVINLIVWAIGAFLLARKQDR